jgi:hypothetical protein
VISAIKWVFMAPPVIATAALLASSMVVVALVAVLGALVQSLWRDLR